MKDLRTTQINYAAAGPLVSSLIHSTINIEPPVSSAEVHICLCVSPGPPQFVPSVTELVVAQCYYLDFDDKGRNKPVYVYLNSTGCMNDKGQAISAGT